MPPEVAASAHAPTLLAYGIELPSVPFPTGRLLPAVAGAGERWSFDLQPCGTRRGAEAGGDEVSQEDAFGRRPVDHEDGRVTIPFGDCDLEVRRDARVIVLRHDGESFDPERLVHPMLSAAAMWAAHWSDWVPLHAGAVVLGGQAWAVLAERGLGKSSTMAALADAGHTVLTDDLLVIDGAGDAHAGPRCVDLRAGGIADQRDDLIEVTTVTDRSRLRMPLGPAPAKVPLGGFIRLAWGDEVRAARVSPLGRGPVLGSAFSISGLPIAPRLVLDLTTQPMAILERPKTLASLPATIAALEAFAEANG